MYSLDKGWKLNVYKTTRKRPRQLLYVLCMVNLRPLSRGYKLSINEQIRTILPGKIVSIFCISDREKSNLAKHFIVERRIFIKILNSFENLTI